MDCVTIDPPTVDLVTAVACVTNQRKANVDLVTTRKKRTADLVTTVDLVTKRM